MKSLEQKVFAGGFDRFKERARSILCNQEDGFNKKDRKLYIAWTNRIAELMDNSGFTNSQAVIEASKGFPCLIKLLEEYDISKYDPNPENHSLQGTGPPKKVKSENKKQTHKENLNWAISAVGEFLRTGGKEPKICPNNAAYYLYVQAKTEPKDFLTKYTQVESRSVEDEESRRLGKSVQRSISELDAMLDSLDSEEKN